MLEKGATQSTTDDEERGGTLLQVGSGSSQRRDQLKSIRRGKLVKVGQTWDCRIAEREVPSHLTCGGTYYIRVGFDFSFGATRARAEAGIEKTETVACDRQPDVQGKRLEREACWCDRSFWNSL